MKNIAISLVLAGMLMIVPAAGFAFAQEQTRITEEGLASWYGGEFHGRKTANGEIFDTNQLTAEALGLISSGVARVRIDATLPVLEAKASAKQPTDDSNSTATEKPIVLLNIKPLPEIDRGLAPLQHTIQVASFGVSANADKLVVLLKLHGLNPETENLADSGRIRVVLRSIADPGLASALTELKGLGFDQVIVRPQ